MAAEGDKQPDAHQHTLRISSRFGRLAVGVSFVFFFFLRCPAISLGFTMFWVRFLRI